MRSHRKLRDAAVEDLLAGRIPVRGAAGGADDELASLAALIGDVRSLGAEAAPAPSAALAAILDEGLPADVLDLAHPVGGVPASSAARGASRRPTPLRKAIPAMFAALFGWIASLSMAGKAAVALTAAGALAAGGAAVDLPSAVSDALERRGQDEVVESESDDLLEGTAVEDDVTEERERPEDATDASTEGRAKATENTADTPARVPATVGPGTGEDQRIDPTAPESTPPTSPPARTPAPRGEGGPPASPPAAPQGEDRAPEQTPEQAPQQAPEQAPAPPPQRTSGDEARRQGPASPSTSEDGTAGAPGPDATAGGSAATPDAPVQGVLPDDPQRTPPAERRP